MFSGAGSYKVRQQAMTSPWQLTNWRRPGLPDIWRSRCNRRQAWHRS